MSQSEGLLAGIVDSSVMAGSEFVDRRIEYAVSPRTDPEDNPVTEMIREETDLGEDELPRSEIVGVTDDDGDRLEVVDSSGLYDGWTSDEYSFDAGDVADQAGEDVQE
ncbi:hypothetical protein GJ633_14750, partial [Halorubrum sp. CBA1125]|uniref:hypothetical protein n=1 Tax=Halorubrum sp. CBA1125 TaxID=2668072 RepID=UPI0012E7DEEA